MPMCMLAGRHSLRPARSGCASWNGLSGQPVSAPAGRQPVAHALPSAQYGGTALRRSGRCSGDFANGHVSMRALPARSISTVSPSIVCSVERGSADVVTRPRPCRNAMRRPWASMSIRPGPASVASASISSTRVRPRPRSTARSLPRSSLTARHSTTIAPPAERYRARPRRNRTPAPFGTSTRAPGSISAPRRSGPSAARTRRDAVSRVSVAGPWQPASTCPTRLTATARGAAAAPAAAAVAETRPGWVGRNEVWKVPAPAWSSASTEAVSCSTGRPSSATETVTGSPTAAGTIVPVSTSVSPACRAPTGSPPSLLAASVSTAGGAGAPVWASAEPGCSPAHRTHSARIDLLIEWPQPRRPEGGALWTCV